jgi:serine/threonine protein phosphatase PrpC
VASFAPPGPGLLVVCSDGLWNYASDTDELARLVRAHPPGAPLIGLARALVDFAIASGGHDNVTVTVTDVTPPVEGNRT